MHLILLEHGLNRIGLDFVNFSLNFGKTVQTSIFPKTRFSPKIEVGFKLYIVYMISKNGCDWFHQVLTCFTLKT
jgi:hypothetical protein